MRLPPFACLNGQRRFQPGLHPCPFGVQDTVVDRIAAMAMRAQHVCTHDTFLARPQTFNRPLRPYIAGIDHELNLLRFQRLKRLAEQEVFALELTAVRQ